MSRQYLVTGAIGHLGNTVIRMLLENRSRVRALVHPDDDIEALAGLPIELSYGDVCHKDSMKDFFQVEDPRQTIVIHAAEVISISDKRDPSIHRVNVQGTVNVTDMCIKLHIGRLVYVGSAHAIPKKKGAELIEEVDFFSRDLVEGDYAKSKAEATQYILSKVKLNVLNAVVVHPSGMIGPNEFGASAVDNLIREYLSGKLTASVRGGYEFVDVRDVAAGIISAAERGIKGSCYILSNKYVSTKTFLNDLHNITGQKPIKRVFPAWLARRNEKLAGVYYRILKRPSLHSKYSLFTFFPHSRFSHKRAEHELFFQTRDMNASLVDTVSWIEYRRRIDMERILSKRMEQERLERLEKERLERERLERDRIIARKQIKK
jgi:dihydroflavonol-4-reductase